jgi:hypothetical protein
MPRHFIRTVPAQTCLGGGCLPSTDSNERMI